jgi:hypothetical protein
MKKMMLISLIAAGAVFAQTTAGSAQAPGKSQTTKKHNKKSKKSKGTAASAKSAATPQK